jgi:hypothetical protein
MRTDHYLAEISERAKPCATSAKAARRRAQRARRIADQRRWPRGGGK